MFPLCKLIIRNDYLYVTHSAALLISVARSAGLSDNEVFRIQYALEEAKKAAAGKDIRIGGGVSTIRQFLQAGYIDEIHFAFSPVFLGSGENLFSGIDFTGLGFGEIQKISGEGATHIILTKS